ncbi:MAG: peptidylprolyl isomerase [Desulfobacterales bacterium]|nr:peptidylprolyl isomerase [Desulfobacterales bacterium]
MMLTERDGERLRASHILRLVPVGPQDVQRVLDTAEVIRTSVTSGEVLFSEAAAEYSLDPSTRSRAAAWEPSFWPAGTLALLKWFRHFPLVTCQLPSRSSGERPLPYSASHPTRPLIFGLLTRGPRVGRKLLPLAAGFQ